MKGNFRVLGNDKWTTKATVAQDLGQGATGTTSTTINVEATDEVPAPFYKGTIETEDGEIDCKKAAWFWPLIIIPLWLKKEASGREQ